MRQVKVGEHIGRALLGAAIFSRSAASVAPSSAAPTATASPSGWKLAASWAAARLTMREPRRCSLRTTALGGSFRSHTIPAQESTFNT